MIFFLNFSQVRVSSESNEYLINPFGLLFNEITASSLVKCDASGNVVDEGSTTLGKRFSEGLAAFNRNSKHFIFAILTHLLKG